MKGVFTAAISSSRSKIHPQQTLCRHSKGSAVGCFITFEGTEGCGKSVQTKLLSKFLKSNGYKVFVTREPGNTNIGLAIRKLLLDPKNKSLDIITELFLYLADRAQHVKEVIEPYLKKGYIVLCDRFMDATTAYQGYGRKLPLGLIHSLNKLATRGIKPCLTLLLDVPVKLGLQRAKRVGPEGGDRMERQALKFHMDVYKGYHALAKKEPKRFKIVKVNRSIKEIHEEIKKIVLKKLTA
jgi:dTMP kinase